jgi:putative NIF3 family GTP cyclohydrolase 1 type 2
LQHLAKSIILSADPVISNGLRSLTLGDPKQQSLLRLASAGISVYSPHTAVDAINGGMADWLCDIITGNLPEAEPEAEIRSVTSAPANRDPETQSIDNVVLIDNNDDPFTERATASDSPLVNGLIGKTNSQSSKQAAQIKRSHSQPSYPTDTSSAPQPDLSSSQEPTPHTRKVLHPSSFFSLNSLPADTPYTASNTGFGRLVTFSTPQPLTHLIELIARGLGNPKGFAIAIPQSTRVEDMRISTVGICPGSGSEVLKDCISMDKEKSVDLLFTGELGHHEALAATESGAAVVALFHSNSERGFLHAVMRSKLDGAVGEEWKKARTQELGRESRRESWGEVLRDESVKVDVSQRDRDPFGIVVLQDSGVEGTRIT